MLNTRRLTPTATPTFPDKYKMILDLNGEAEGYENGDHIIFSATVEPKRGDLVCVHLRSGKAVIMVQEADMMPNRWAFMPYRERDGDEGHAVFVGRVLGGTATRVVKLEDCYAVHRSITGPQN